MISDRSTDQAREDELCECDHTAHWHSHDGKGDCEGTKFGAPGSWIPCECKAFSAVSDTAGWKEAVDTYYDDPYSRISAMFNAGQDMAERLRVVLKEHDEAKLHLGDDPTNERIREAHSAMFAEWLGPDDGLHNAYKQGHDERCYICALLQQAADAKADLLRAEEALQELLQAAEAETAKKTTPGSKTTEEWAAVNLNEGYQVPGVQRRILLARAVLKARAALPPKGQE